MPTHSLGAEDRGIEFQIIDTRRMNELLPKTTDFGSELS